MPARVILVVEDQLSLAVAERLVEHAAPGTEVALRQVVRGRDRVRAELPKYVNACCVMPHFVLVDLDSDPCPRALLEAWKVFPPRPGLLIRVVPREVEAWVLADRPGFASFASVPMNKLPHAPETLADAKQTLINLARRSKSRRLASELVPAQGSRLSIGPMYNERVGAFVRQHWSIGEAASSAPALRRALERLGALLNDLAPPL
jgi:hypothetical protein